MPIYEYRCSQCGHEVEVMHPISEAGPQSCEVCGGAMRKSLSLPSIHFKGSGWAKKDAATAARSRSTSDSTRDPGPGSKGDGGKGTKPEGDSKASDAEGSSSTTAAPASTDKKAD